MSRYQDKSVEEIRPIVERYFEAYRQRTGREPDHEELKRKLTELADKKEEREFHSAFEHLTPYSLRMAAMCAMEGAEIELPYGEKADEANTEHKCNANSDNTGKKRGRPRKSA